MAEEEALLLEKRAFEVEQEIARLRLSAMKTEDERATLERKTIEAEFLTERLVVESERRVSEANELKDELLKSRFAEKLAKEKLLNFISSESEATTSSLSVSIDFISRFSSKSGLI